MGASPGGLMPTDGAPTSRAGAAAPTAPAVPAEPALDLLQAKILIVDDKPANVALLTKLLGDAGYSAVMSTTDPTVVQALYLEHRFDLIVLDLQMPDMDGFAVMDALRTIELGGYLPVLVITAQPGHKLRALRAGARDFISKPFDIAEVLTRVHNMIEVRLLHAELRRQRTELQVLFDQVVAERKVSERLALHVGPGSIAARLHARPDMSAESIASATVLIADVTGFSALPKDEGPEALTLVVDEIFAAFDAIAAEHGVRKVKTLGNSYMAVSGAPVETTNHAIPAARMALAMLGALERFNERSGRALQARVGIATGPIVAGVIGRRMYLYDIWGETVTVAARMESHGVAGRVQVSSQTRDALGDGFALEARGSLEVEGMGAVATWFVGASREHSNQGSMS